LTANSGSPNTISLSSEEVALDRKSAETSLCKAAGGRGIVRNLAFRVLIFWGSNSVWRMKLNSLNVRGIGRQARRTTGGAGAGSVATAEGETTTGLLAWCGLFRAFFWKKKNPAAAATTNSPIEKKITVAHSCNQASI
jgi:hypothetical protein